MIVRGLALTLLVVCVGTDAAVAVSAGTSPRTQIVANVTPFTSDGHLRHGRRVVRETRGSCGPGSDVLPNNVYRCGFGNVIVDPCWRDYRASVPAVVCLGAPWAETVIRLLLATTPAPPTGHSNLNAEPWGITLRSGARCLAFQGAHDTLTGREGAPVIDYYCSRTLALIRGIHRGHRAWTIRAARITNRLSHPYAPIGRVAIRTAWFGGNDPLSRHP